MRSHLVLAAAVLALSAVAACHEPARAGRRPHASSAPAATSDASSPPTRRAAGAPPATAAARDPRRPVDTGTYRWLTAADAEVRRLDDTFPPPAGFRRVELAPASFGAFLRGLPLRPAGAAVHTFEGDELRRGDDPRVAAVIALDAGTRDLQQCADTALRLHAEWLWSRGAEGDLGYHFTSGDLATWERHRAGERPVVDGRAVRWARRAAPSGGRAAFRQWLDLVFTYAGTVSLARHAAPVERGELRPGDVFVLPGGPGHAVLVLDVAVNPRGRRVALLGQGFMPAQEAHVLAAAPATPWFDLDVDAVDTPFWPAPFPWSSLRRMRTASGATE